MRRTPLLSPATVIATIALLVALAGTGYAAKDQITGAQIKNKTIRGADLAPNSVNSRHIRRGAVGPSDLRNNAVDSRHIRNGRVRSSDLVPSERGAGVAGAQGPQGPQGAAGPQGIPGPEGLEGLPGIFFFGLGKEGSGHAPPDGTTVAAVIADACDFPFEQPVGMNIQRILSPEDIIIVEEHVDPQANRVIVRFMNAGTAGVVAGVNVQAVCAVFG